jgi:phosphatidylglycerophosphate synthase
MPHVHFLEGFPFLMNRTDLTALTIAFLVVLTMPIFAVVSRGRPRDADVARRPTTILLGYWIRDWVMWFIGPLDRFLIRNRVSPDVFNWLGLAFGLASAAAYGYGQLALAAWMVLLGGAADILDGRIARARNICSAYGDFLDSTLDRFSEVFSFIGIAIYLSADLWMVMACMLALSASLLVSYARARGEVLGVDFAGGLMQRAERLVLLALASFLDAPVTAYYSMPAGTLLAYTVAGIGVASMWTAVHRTYAIARVLKQRD